MTEYDASVSTYTLTRQADPRIAAAIERGLGDAHSVVNVGAGTGSYEPAGREVIAVEPSATMRGQRPAGAAPAIDAKAEALPLEDSSVDAALAILTVHHWDDPARGLAELCRVARDRVVILTFDPDQCGTLWFVRDYLPEAGAFDRGRFQAMAEVEVALTGRTRVERVPIPHDCSDGFLGAFWRRPERYLEPVTRKGISTFRELDAAVVERAIERLRLDIASGAWRRNYGGLLGLEELDLGYRLVVSEMSSR